jgi:HK97 family phage portal protein
MTIKSLFSKFKQKAFTGSTWAGFSGFTTQWNTTKYLQTYTDSIYVYACVRKRAEKVGQIEFRLHRGDKEIFKDPILDLLYKPNAFQSKNEFFELYQIYKDLAGSTYIYVEREGKKIVGLHNMRPDYVTELRSKQDGSIVGYEYRVNGQPIKFKPEEVIASHYPSPMSMVAGHSPVQTARGVIDTQIQLETYQANVMRNGGKVEGLINVKADHLSEDQLKELKLQFTQQYAGAKKSGVPFFSYGDMTYSNLGLSPSELSYIESKKFTRADILAIYGVPLPIIDTSDVGALGSNGYDAALKIFLSETIKPLMANLVVKLNEFLVADEFELSFIDPSPEDTDRKLKVIDSGVKNYYMTTNEARSIMGLTPLTDGDTILLPFNLMPQTVTEKAVKKKMIDHPLKSKEFRDQYFKGYKQGLTKEIELFRKVLKKYLKDQQERVLGPDTKAFVSDRFNMAEEDRIGVSVFYPVLERLFKESGQNLFDIYGDAGNFVLKPKFRESLEARAQFFVHEINNTTFQEMQNVFENSVEENLTRAQLVDAMNELYDGRIEDTRAQMIVRTETHHAIEEGKLDGYGQMGFTIKIWVHNPVSADPREEHIAIDGEEVNIDEPFSNGLWFPGDGDASESINCNCTI